MRFLRQMQKSLPHGRRHDRQRPEQKKRHRVHPVHGVREKLPQEGAVAVLKKQFPRLSLIYEARTGFL